jgi:hypothetical protein
MSPLVEAADSMQLPCEKSSSGSNIKAAGCCRSPFCYWLRLLLLLLRRLLPRLLVHVRQHSAWSLLLLQLPAAPATPGLA